MREDHGGTVVATSAVRVSGYDSTCAEPNPSPETERRVVQPIEWC